MYDIEKITKVNTVADAISALVASPDAIIIAGGSDVLIKIREGKLAGCTLVSIREIPELKGIKLEKDETIQIGPLTTFSQLTENPIIMERIPVLGNAVDQVGGPQIRNIGTIGGNISNGVTSADSASTLCALNAEIEITGPKGVRKVPILEYYVKAGKVCLEQGELCTAIRIHPEDYKGYKGHYIKYAMRNAMDIATLGCSVVAKLNKDILEDVRIAFGVAGPIPMRCPNTENAIKGKVLNSDVYEIMRGEILSDINPRTSWRASQEFRVQLAQELPGRALKIALEGQNI